MNVENIEAYFADKIGKSIEFDIGFLNKESQVHSRRYAIEPTVINGQILCALLSIRFTSHGDEKTGRAKYCGEVEIPFEDGDTLESIFDMAAAGANFGRSSLQVEVAGPGKDRIAKAYTELQNRLDAAAPAPPQGP